ncbi:hypothetical protein GCM10010347_21200 [Streptomyces cirratus]|uniref:Uncharacterized protein n=1 Tax=Streptomyces cirratus TaxID=68187 RepID=A0ABQ3EQM4_9ACTN|nr:hypothetical protein GCM10010347_21200 [Streptomyces cirratus]
MPPGYTDPIQFQAGNPYGASHVAGDGPPGEVARGPPATRPRRVAETAAFLQAGRAARVGWGREAAEAASFRPRVHTPAGRPFSAPRKWITAARGCTGHAP